jgi:AraC family transcriptional regulator
MTSEWTDFPGFLSIFRNFLRSAVLFRDETRHGDMTSNSQAHRRSLSVPGRKLLALQASAKSSTSDRRIQVIEGRRWVPIVSPKPTLSSAPYGWDGILVERYNSMKVLEDRERTRTTVIVHLHLGAPAQQAWPLGGKRKRIPVVPGSIQLPPQGPSRSARIEESTDALVLLIEPTLLAQALGESWPSGSVELTPQIGLRDSQLESLMRALQAELEAGVHFGSLFAETVAQGLAVYLAQRYAAFPPRLATYRGGLPKKSLHRVLQYVEDQLDENLSLLVMAEVAGISPNHFSELFSRSTGVSPHQYVLGRRMERAKRLLRDVRISIVEVSAQAGFVNQSHFARLFRRVVGVSPTEYRRKA